MAPLRRERFQLKESALAIEDPVASGEILREAELLRISIQRQSRAMAQHMTIAALRYASFAYDKRAKEAMMSAVQANETLAQAAKDVIKMNDTIAAERNPNTKAELIRNLGEISAAIEPVLKRFKYFRQDAEAYQMRVGDVNAAQAMRAAAAKYVAESRHVLDVGVDRIRRMRTSALARNNSKVITHLVHTQPSTTCHARANIIRLIQPSTPPCTAHLAQPSATHFMRHANLHSTTNSPRESINTTRFIMKTQTRVVNERAQDAFTMMLQPEMALSILAWQCAAKTRRTLSSRWWTSENTYGQTNGLRCAGGYTIERA